MYACIYIHTNSPTHIHLHTSIHSNIHTYIHTENNIQACTDSEKIILHQLCTSELDLLWRRSVKVVQLIY